MSLSPSSGCRSGLAGGARHSLNSDEDEEDGGKEGRQSTSTFDGEGESGRGGSPEVGLHMTRPSLTTPTAMSQDLDSEFVSLRGDGSSVERPLVADLVCVVTVPQLQLPDHSPF